MPTGGIRTRTSGIMIPAYVAAVASTFTAFDPSKKGTNLILSGSNLVVTFDTGAADNYNSVAAVAGATTGKKYCEFTLDRAGTLAAVIIGFATAAKDFGPGAGSAYLGADPQSLGWASGNGNVYAFNGTIETVIQTLAVGDTGCMAMDLGASKIWFRTNGGNWNNDILANQDPANNIGGINYSGFGLDPGPYYPAVTLHDHTASGDQWTANFGASAYAQAVPAGFSNW